MGKTTTQMDIRKMQDFNHQILAQCINGRLLLTE
ncbi:hypothetical protein SPLC1_S240880 [Arthrospira platensis C1]|nr:hypothetical protein SPLC1_S240880 [Arthrospira platensis C1]